MIAGIGMAMVEIDRIERLIRDRPHSLERWFGPEEAGRARNRRRPGEEIAGRFACKMAVRHAMAGRYISSAPLRLLDVVTGNDPLGKPFVSLRGEAAAWAERQFPLRVDFQVSITHSRDTAAAVAVFSLSEA